MSTFWTEFYNKPLDQIPWQSTQADWFKELIDKEIIKGSSALDLGCGTGTKSIYLSKHGFTKVIGVDIVANAIKIAKQSADKECVNSVCKFVQHDASDWLYLNEEKFDFILDWANLHGIPADQRTAYVKGIAKHSKPGTLFLIRTFTTTDTRTFFKEFVGGVSSKIYLFKKKEIMELFPDFKLLQEHTSEPKTKKDLIFLELLFKKIK